MKYRELWYQPLFFYLIQLYERKCKQMKEKLYHLEMVRNYIDDDMFKFAVASMLINHYIGRMMKQRNGINRAKLLDRVNLTLKSIGCSEVSYGFLRSYC
jgi:N-dimethylarginine dimethylaminohydrolase